MKRLSKLERRYVLEALDNEFKLSLNNVFKSRLEKKFADIFNVRYAISHSNGTATIHTGLASLGVKADDEVIVPALTMASPAMAVLHNNSIPVFADVDPLTFNISAETIKKVITKKTKAIITVALYGLPPDYDEILKICKKHNIFLIEDNAQCFLGVYKGKLVGQFGHFASFSFASSKHLTCGEGGMLITNDEYLANKARQFSFLGYPLSLWTTKQRGAFRDSLYDPQYERHFTLGFNYRMSELQAAMALAQLERAHKLIENRIKVAKIFHNVIKTTNLFKTQSIPPNGQYKHVYWTFPIVLNTNKPEKDWYKFKNLFIKYGGDGFYSAWKATYLEPLFFNIVQKMPGVWQKYKMGLCPNAEFLQQRIIQLKTNYWNLKEAEKQGKILEKTIKKFY